MPVTKPTTAIALPPKLPRPVQFANAAAALVRKVGLEFIKLDEQSLVREATKATGLSDFGDGPFLEPMRLLLESLECDARLSLLGRTIAKAEIVRLLSNRLQMVRDRAENPQIAEVEIRRPLFVVGLPRTGSTILHDLLARDPRSRAPLTWECMYPSPPPERESYETDARIETCDGQFVGVDRLIPGFKAMHPMGARLAQECVVLSQHSFCSPIFHNEYRVTAYQDWFDACADISTETWPAVYDYHRQQLQHLSWRCPGERWVLKSGMHMWALEHLFSVYPDACIVQTHRDPVKVATSYASLTTLVRSMSSDAVDPAEIASDWTPRLAAALDHAIDVRESGSAASGSVFDMHFTEFLTDPMSVVEKIYDHFDLELTGDAADAMCVFIAENPQGKHGLHRYTPEEYGLDVATERERFARYTGRFGIEPEAAGSIEGKLRDL
ncbi:MAG: sulfotransferase [Myxococcota bacterium]